MTPPPPAQMPLYLFLDEGGDFNFSPSGSTYFTITSVATKRPFVFDAPLTNLRFDLIETGLDLQAFHASEDRQPIRDRVFAVLKEHLTPLRVDSVIVDKCKTAPSVREDSKFYPRMLGYLIRYVLDPRGMGIEPWSEVIVITDRIPINKKRAAVEKAVKTTLAAMLPAPAQYRLLHHESKSCCGLQVADYFNWAIYRAWERGDRRSLRLVERAIVSQFDIFERGSYVWYRHQNRRCQS
jgi:hypothetical protein